MAQAPDRNLALELVRVTEVAAIAAARGQLVLDLARFIAREGLK